MAENPHGQDGWKPRSARAPGPYGPPMIEVRGLSKRSGHRRRRRAQLRRPPRRGHRVPGPQRRRQVHHHAAAPGLDEPDAGRPDRGRRYRELPWPLRRWGAAGGQGVPPGRSARAHLAALAAATGSGARGRGGARPGGLEGAPAGGPGPLARHGPAAGIAAALLATRGAAAGRAGQRPGPRGIRWMRTLLRSLAAEGGRVVSSHLIGEMASRPSGWWSSPGTAAGPDVGGELSARSTSLEEAFLELTAGGWSTGPRRRKGTTGSDAARWSGSSASLRSTWWTLAVTSPAPPPCVAWGSTPRTPPPT